MTKQITVSEISSACEAMYKLNRVAKKAAKSVSHVIYQRKAELICYLYQAGYCVAAYEHNRPHSYDEWTPNNSDESSTYTTTERLLCFHFEFENKKYCWHTQRVDFEWVVTAPSQTWNEERIGETVVMTSDEISDALRTVEIITADPATIEGRNKAIEGRNKARVMRERKEKLAERALKAKINRRLAPLGQRLYRSGTGVYAALDENGVARWEGELNEWTEAA
jgi:hypothetical protein